MIVNEYVYWMLISCKRPCSNFQQTTFSKKKSWLKWVLCVIKHSPMNRAKNCFIFKDLLIRKKNKPLCFLKVLGAQSSLLTWKGMSRWASKSSLFQMFLLVLLCRCRSELWESIQLSLAQLWPEAGGTWWLFCAMTMLRGWCHRHEFSPNKKTLKRTHVIFNHDLWTLWKFWTIGFEIGGFPDTSDPQLQWYPFCPRNRYLQVRRDHELPNVL